MNEWEVKDAAATHACAALLKHVKGIFLKDSFITLVEMTVLPKIATAVKYWSPTVDRTPIDAWVLPWVPVIGRSISTVFPGTMKKRQTYKHARTHTHTLSLTMTLTMSLTMSLRATFISTVSTMFYEAMVLCYCALSDDLHYCLSCPHSLISLFIL